MSCNIKIFYKFLNWERWELNLHERFLVILSRLGFRYDPQNRRIRSSVAVPQHENSSLIQIMISYHGADHVGTIFFSKRQHLTRNDLPNKVTNNTGSIKNVSCNRVGYNSRNKFCNFIMNDIRINNSTKQNYRGFCTDNQGPIGLLETTLCKIIERSKTLTPTIVKHIENNTWPMLRLSGEIKQLVRLRQKYISLLSIRDGVRSALIKQTVNNWLTKVDMRVNAVELTYRSRGNRTPGMDGKTLRAKDLINRLQNLKFKNLLTYSSGPIRRVYISKGKGKIRPLGIPNIQDRITQNLFLQVIEPLIDPHADKFSFGFRRGRCPHQAIGILSKSLHSKPNSKVTKDTKKSYFVHTKYILNIDIEQFFEKVDHIWLLENYPFPEKFLFILKGWLKSTVIYQNIAEASVQGFPQGSVIGPSLANFTLNGLEQASRPTQVTVLSPAKQKHEEAKGYFHKPGSSKLRKTVSSVLIRYADDFVVVVNDLNQLVIIGDNIGKFLLIRGLTRNLTKSKTIKWVDNAKFNYLGFTFHYILNKNKRSKVSAQRKKGSHFVRGGLYVYPEKSKVQEFKAKIKMVFKNNINNSAFQVINILNPIIRGWGNYFNVGITKTFANLDHFIWKRSWRYLTRKFKKVSKGILVQRYYQGVTTPSGRTWHFHGTKINSSVDALKRKGIYAWVVLLSFLGAPLPAQMFSPTKDLTSSNYYISEQVFTNYNLKINERRQKGGKYVNKYNLLYKNQNGKCIICNQGLGYINSIELEIHHINKVSDAGLKDGALNKIENLQLLHKECHKTTLKNKELKYFVKS